MDVKESMWKVLYCKPDCNYNSYTIYKTVSANLKESNRYCDDFIERIITNGVCLVSQLTYAIDDKNRSCVIIQQENNEKITFLLLVDKENDYFGRLKDCGRFFIIESGSKKQIACSHDPFVCSSAYGKWYSNQL
jgi:hypothetical protein